MWLQLLFEFSESLLLAIKQSFVPRTFITLFSAAQRRGKGKRSCSGSAWVVIILNDMEGNHRSGQTVPSQYFIKCGFFESHMESGLQPKIIGKPAFNNKYSVMHWD